MSPEKLLLLPLLAAFASPAAIAEVTLTSEQVVGVWTVCYEPGLEGVVELDTTVLMILPGGRYHEMHEPIGDDLVITESGQWELDGHEIVLTAEQFRLPSGEPPPGMVLVTQRLLYEDSRSSVLGPRDEPRARAVLMSPDATDLNYAWCRTVGSWIRSASAD